MMARAAPPAFQLCFLAPCGGEQVLPRTQSLPPGAQSQILILMPWFLALPEFWFRKAFPRCVRPSSLPGTRQR
ncbi:hypothetical protein MUG91_G339n7 [Manis pentadactyla]|nr:hypothetical protein MUG91_G339n7 [Manis pentadactyla]